MKWLNGFFAFLLAVTLVGCSTHSTMRGSVAMKISEDEAHVCMGNKDVKVGDRVNAFINVCTNGTGKAKRSSTNEIVNSCTKEKIGVGTVTSLLNEHYSVVKFDTKLDFSEGTIIEKF